MLNKCTRVSWISLRLTGWWTLVYPNFTYRGRTFYTNLFFANFRCCISRFSQEFFHSYCMLDNYHFLCQLFGLVTHFVFSQKRFVKITSIFPVTFSKVNFTGFAGIFRIRRDFFLCRNTFYPLSWSFSSIPFAQHNFFL